jgi:hypothetical protein
MYMKKIGVDLSPHQRRRLHNGHKVRVKKGEGIMMVNPGKFDTMSRTFLRGKAKEIQLSADEIMANRMTSPEAHNYNELSRPPSVAPQVAPIRGNVAGGRISNVGGPRGIRVRTMDGLKNVSDHLQMLDDYTGGKYGSQLKAGLGNLMANTATATMGHAGVDARKNIVGGAITASTFYGDMAKKALADARKGISGGGRGNFYGDNQIALGYGIGRKGQIGVSGNLLSNQRVLPQALQSQPYSANWSMANQMPPQYQQFNRS